MKNIYLTTLLLGAIGLSGCGGGGGNDSTPNSTNNTESTIKKYNIVATPTSGRNCRGADGTMIIEGSSVSGTIKTGWGDNLIIGGTYSSQNGDISGGFAKNSTRLATYSGNIQNNKGSGNWSDNLGCSGTWTATGLSSNITSSQRPTTTNNSKSFDAQNLQGYEINYQGQELISYKIKFACDGSFKVTATRHGVNVIAMSGDDIIINYTRIILKSEVNVNEQFIISLIDGDVVIGQSVDDDGNIITEVKKVSSCN